jgi:hypothetical protein
MLKHDNVPEQYLQSEGYVCVTVIQWVGKFLLLGNQEFVTHYKNSFNRYWGEGRKVTTCQYLVLRSRMTGVIPQLLILPLRSQKKTAGTRTLDPCINTPMKDNQPGPN